MNTILSLATAESPPPQHPTTSVETWKPSGSQELEDLYTAWGDPLSNYANLAELHEPSKKLQEALISWFDTYEHYEHPFRRTERGVQFDESKMEVHRPYPFKLPDSDLWLIAVRRSSTEGDVKLYQLA